MVFQPVTNTAQATVINFLQGQTVVNTYYAQYDVGQYDQTALNLLAQAFNDWYSTELLQFLSVDLLYQRVEVRGLELQNDLTATNSDNAGTGGVAQGALPNNVSFCVSRRSGLTGRSARGRVYLPGLTVSSLPTANESTVTTVFRDNVVGALNAIPTYLTAINWVEVIVSRYSNGVQRPEGAWFEVTEYAATDLIIDTQRRRLPS